MVIGGVNPVLEALRAHGRRVQRIYLAEGRSTSGLRDLQELAHAAGVRIQKTDRERLDKLFQAKNHQGVVAVVGPYAYWQIEEILEKAAGPQALVLILDSIQDPMNLGSLIRSADAAGAAGIVIPREKSAPVTPTVVKASAGAAEYVPVARAVNLVQAIETMKKEGFWIVGADASAKETIYEIDLPPRLGLVVGAEGKGLRRLVKEKCDLLAAIPLRGKVASLNASVAGAVAMFEHVRRYR
jgi:23S rRNA (guanosine2251-2'-O)-methyltransferase